MKLWQPYHIRWTFDAQHANSNFIEKLKLKFEKERNFDTPENSTKKCKEELKTQKSPTKFCENKPINI